MLLTIAWISLAIATACMLLIAIDLLAGNRQAMAIMNVVWPVTALWAGPAGLWLYLRHGRAGSARAAAQAKARGEDPPNLRQPFPVLVAKGTTHCGSGCTLGDIAAESLAAIVPLMIFGQQIFGAWVYDYALAYLLGIGFQYLTIKPMRGVSAREALVDAVKADTLSLTAWQVGMFGWMALARFALFGHDLARSSPIFWFMMQIAMLMGFATSYPVNWWLLRRGIKEPM